MLYYFIINGEEKDAKDKLDGNIEIVKYLYDVHHASIEALDMRKRKSIYYAIINGHLDIVQFLCEVCNTNLDCKDEFRFTSADYARHVGNIEIINQIITKVFISFDSECNSLLNINNAGYNLFLE